MESWGCGSGGGGGGWGDELVMEARRHEMDRSKRRWTGLGGLRGGVGSWIGEGKSVCGRRDCKVGGEGGDNFL